MFTNITLTMSVQNVLVMTCTGSVVIALVYDTAFEIRNVYGKEWFKGTFFLGT